MASDSTCEKGHPLEGHKIRIGGITFPEVKGNYHLTHAYNSQWIVMDSNATSRIYAEMARTEEKEVGPYLIH